MSELGVNALIQGGAWSIVTLVVLLVLRGNLVSRAVLEDVRKDRNERLAELTADRDKWRDAYLESEKGRMEAQAQAGELLELSRTAAHALVSIRGEVHGDAMDPEVAAPPS